MTLAKYCCIYTLPFCFILSLQKLFKLLEMGLGPSKVTEQLFVGSLRDGTDAKKLEKAEITHIVTILSSLQYKTEEQKSTDQFTIPVRSSKFKRMRISIPDKSSSDLTPYFAETSQFIHSAIYNENGIVLIHCAEGVSRSERVWNGFFVSFKIILW